MQGDRLLLNDVYPDKFREELEKRLKGKNVDVVLNDAIAGSVPPEDVRYRSVRTREGRELRCDLLVRFVGSAKRTVWLTVSFYCRSLVEVAGRIRRT